MKAVTTKKGVTSPDITKLNQDPDNLPDTQIITPKEEETPPADPPENPDDNPPADPEDNNEGEETPPANTPGTFDYQKKFAESSREAQILASKNRKLLETIDQAANLPEPTEAELKAKYTDWDSLTDFERSMAKEAYTSSKRFEMLSQAAVASKQVDAWAAQVDEFVATPANLQKYPDLDGREAEFRSFAMKESRRGLEFDELATWFSAVAEKPTAPVKQKGPLLQRSNGGQPPAKPQGLTLEQIATIRRTDSRKYKQLVKEGKIKISI